MSNTLSMRLRELRKQQHLTQKDLADKLFIDHSSISKYETGRALPENIVLQKMADFFNVSVDYLLGRTDISISSSQINIEDNNNQKSLNKIMKNFVEGLEGDIMLDGEILDENTKKLFLQSVRNAYEFTKINNKKTK